MRLIAQAVVPDAAEILTFCLAPLSSIIVGQAGSDWLLSFD